jgi:hypothetical protein
MGATNKTITQITYNNSTTPTTVTSQSVASEMISEVTTVSGTVSQKEVARIDITNPGVKGGTKPNN